MELRVSGDYNHQSYKSPSYPNESPDEPLLGGNIGFFTTGIEGWRNANVGLGTNNIPGSASVDNSIQEYEIMTPTSLEDKPASGFVSHLKSMIGLEFVQKRSKDGDTKIAMNMLQLPAYVVYYHQLPEAGNIFGGPGLYFAYGIGGKSKSTFNGSSYEIKTFDKNSGFKPFDFGLSFTAGYKITNSFSFCLAYDYGLANIGRNPGGEIVRNRGISLNVGYPLDKIIKN
jgi:hypothetical protein